MFVYIYIDCLGGDWRILTRLGKIIGAKSGGGGVRVKRWKKYKRASERQCFGESTGGKRGA